MQELLDAPTTAIAKPQPINWTALRAQALASFDIHSEAIASEVAADTLLMVGNDGERTAANKRRMVWVRRRTDLERTRKAAQADAKKIVELVKEVAETFQADFSKAEDHLAIQIDAFDAKVEAEKQAKIDAAFNAKNSQLLHVGIELQRIVVESLADEDIERMVNDKVEADRLRAAEAERNAAAKVESDRVAAEQAEANRVEAAKLIADRAAFATQQAAQQAELDAQRKLLEAAQEKINAAAFAVAEREREQREAEQTAERLRLEAEDKIKSDAFEAERLKVLAEKAAQDAAEKLERDKADDDAARQRAEQLKPDRLKLHEFLDRLVEISETAPTIQQPEMVLAADGIAVRLSDCIRACRKLIEE